MIEEGIDEIPVQTHKYQFHIKMKREETKMSDPLFKELAVGTGV